MICEHCWREYKAVHELEGIQCYDNSEKEYLEVFECPICNWILPTPKEKKI